MWIHKINSGTAVWKMVICPWRVTSIPGGNQQAKMLASLRKSENWSWRTTIWQSKKLLIMFGSVLVPQNSILNEDLGTHWFVATLLSLYRRQLYVPIWKDMLQCVNRDAEFLKTTVQSSLWSHPGSPLRTTKAWHFWEQGEGDAGCCL